MDLFLPFVVVAGLLWFAIAVVTTPLIAALLLMAVTEARGPRGYR